MGGGGGYDTPTYVVNDQVYEIGYLSHNMQWRSQNAEKVTTTGTSTDSLQFLNLTIFITHVRDCVMDAKSMKCIRGYLGLSKGLIFSSTRTKQPHKQW